MKIKLNIVHIMIKYNYCIVVILRFRCVIEQLYQFSYLWAFVGLWYAIHNPNVNYLFGGRKKKSMEKQRITLIVYYSNDYQFNFKNNHSFNSISILFFIVLKLNCTFTLEASLES